MARYKCSYYGVMLCVFLFLQGGFWWYSHTITPKLSVVPNPMSTSMLQGLSFGDEQFMFRLMAFQLGNAGDTFGRSTALRDYDLSKVRDWFMHLDVLDSESNLLPSMAAYYFSQTQNKDDVKYMVEYLYQHSKDNPKKWWWQAQAAYIAMHKMKDDNLAIEIATPLERQEGIPFWARQIAAFIYEKRGEFDAALGIMENILAHAKEIPQGELNFMHHFVKERLNKLDELNQKSILRLKK